jgi:hypothetical protein
MRKQRGGTVLAKRGATSVVALALVLLGGCSPERETEQPMEPSAVVMAATATAVISGVEYTYGCPDWPCPVLPIVAQEIAFGRYFWLPLGTFAKPAIYLTVLKTPVLLRLETEDIKPPPPTDPYLTGPEEMLGAYGPPINQLVCENVALQLHSPDLGVWDFVSGSVGTLSMKETSGAWIYYGLPGTESLSEEDFQALLQGTYDVRSTFGNIAAYEATFKATMQRVTWQGIYQAEVEHSLVCGTSDYFDDDEDEEEEEPPPAPYLIGPVKVRGTRGPDLGLVCKNFDISLVSPDEGPWAYEEGEITLQYLHWGSDLNKWLPTGETSEIYLNAASWDQMLGGSLAVWPDDRDVLAYRVFINGIVSREGMSQLWTFPVEHSFLCLGPDFFDDKYEQVVKR